MRYIFPRQYRLHNAFTSQIDIRETAMPFKDYTLRECEISSAMFREIAKKSAQTEAQTRWRSFIPKRLRGSVVALVNRMRKLNRRCSYVELLRHYCPVKVRADPSNRNATNTRSSHSQCRTGGTTRFSLAHHLMHLQGATIREMRPQNPRPKPWNKSVSLIWHVPQRMSLLFVEPPYPE
jgi:hypothetical protein